MSDFKATVQKKFGFRCGSAPDPIEGAYIAPTVPVAVFKGGSEEGGKEGSEEGK